MQNKLEFYVCNLTYINKGSVFIPGNAFILIVDKHENKIFFQSKKKNHIHTKRNILKSLLRNICKQNR
jgi:hypothetical protein